MCWAQWLFLKCFWNIFEIFLKYFGNILEIFSSCVERAVFDKSIFFDPLFHLPALNKLFLELGMPKDINLATTSLSACMALAIQCAQDDATKISLVRKNTNHTVSMLFAQCIPSTTHRPLCLPPSLTFYRYETTRSKSCRKPNTFAPAHWLKTHWIPRWVILGWALPCTRISRVPFVGTRMSWCIGYWR